MNRGRRAAFEHVCEHGIKEGLPSNSNHCILRLRRDNLMNAQDEEDFVFACLLDAYNKCERQQDKGQQ